jgi:hypothetical protein
MGRFVNSPLINTSALPLNITHSAIKVSYRHYLATSCVAFCASTGCILPNNRFTLELLTLFDTYIQPALVQRPVKHQIDQDLHCKYAANTHGLYIKYMHSHAGTYNSSKH